MCVVNIISDVPKNIVVTERHFLSFFFFFAQYEKGSSNSNAPRNRTRFRFLDSDMTIGIQSIEDHFTLCLQDFSTDVSLGALNAFFFKYSTEQKFSRWNIKKNARSHQDSQDPYLNRMKKKGRKYRAQDVVHVQRNENLLQTIKKTFYDGDNSK